MKKALVLGVLAIFAISIANVNAQDRTNVQEKPKKTYTQEPASKNVDTKAVNQTKQMDPTSKNVSNTKTTGTKVQNVKGGNKVQKNKAMNEVAKKNANVNTTTTTDVKVEKKNEAETVDHAAVSSSKTAGKQSNSVPPTPKEKKATTTKSVTTK